MTLDAHRNFAASVVTLAPAPPLTGDVLRVTGGHGARFPAPPFNVTVWPMNTIATPENAEIVRVTAVVGDEFRGVLRGQEGTTPRTIVTGDWLAQTVTAKTLTDIETVAQLGWIVLGVWMFDLATTEPPTGNQIRLNAGTYQAATKMWVRYLTADGLDAFLMLMRITGILTIQDQDDHTRYVKYQTTGDPLDKSGYIELPVTFSGTAGAMLAAQRVMLGSQVKVGTP